MTSPFVNPVPGRYRRNGRPDRRWLDWHYTLPHDWWLIDLDAVLACPRCRSPLAVVELTTNPEKATSILYKVGSRLDVEAWLKILPSEETDPVFDGNTMCTVRKVFGPDGSSNNKNIQISLEDWARYENRLRRLHRTDCS